ncbi:putative phosphatase YieH [Candidatus Rhodobacter oscarellae]|uniref:Putative phosphatase YieH n=1 Tax=Candidatus Rhodobacter oscarellae TaxID=1675527 RepID=A0A0J9ECX2_9RHOB|nr:HAD-IA family hydrolase [Candidatus Rhodobacter lobularis]KMW60617.1 putative phosphatase YieH [Candidatus Rhodobacter lobularis]
MTPPKLVIFDCDGVLVDSEPVTNRLLRDDLAGRGLDLPYAQIMSLFVGGTMKNVGVRAREMGADIPEDWVDGFYTKMYARLAEGTPLIAGVEGVLDRLDAAGVPYAVGFNGSMQKMGITLGQHASVMARLEGKLYSAHVIGVAKPEPDMYLLAARDAGVAPADCVVVDDSPSGCRAAARAGMRCLGFAEHDDGARLVTEGAEPVHFMAEVAEILGL